MSDEAGCRQMAFLTNISTGPAGLVVSIYSWINEVQRSLHALLTNETETRGQVVLVDVSNISRWMLESRNQWNGKMTQICDEVGRNLKVDDVDDGNQIPCNDDLLMI